MHAFRAGLGNIGQTKFRRVLPLQAGLAIKYNRQERNEGQRTCPAPLKVTAAGSSDHSPRCGKPSAAPLPMWPAPGTAFLAGR